MTNNRIQDLADMPLLPNLHYLDLTMNPITNLKGLDRAPRLETLTLARSWIRDLQELEMRPDQLHNLQVLHMKRNHLRDLKGLPPLANLQELHLDSNQITTLKDMPPLPQLHTLTLDGNQIRDLAGIERAANLRVLNLANNQITDLHGLALPHLQELLLYGNQITSTAGLEGCPHLRELNLNGNAIEEVTELKYLRPLRQTLERLDLQDNPYTIPFDGEHYTWPSRDMGVFFHGVECEGVEQIHQFFENLRMVLEMWKNETTRMIREAKSALQKSPYIDIGEFFEEDGYAPYIIIKNALARNQLSGYMVGDRLYAKSQKQLDQFIP